MKSAAVVVFATLVLVVCAVDETGWLRAPVNSVSSRRADISTITKLRSVIKQIELLADEVDAVLGMAATADHSSEARGMASKRDDDKKRKYGRRRYDAYGVAGRFGRSTN